MKTIIFPPLQACEIRHVNLNPYLGVCAEFPDVYIVSEYCAKGSLQVLGCIFKAKQAYLVYCLPPSIWPIYRAFSLPCTVELPQDWLDTSTRRPFHCFRTPICENALHVYELRPLHHDVTAAKLVHRGNEMAAILVNQIIPVGFEIFPYT